MASSKRVAVLLVFLTLHVSMGNGDTPAPVTLYKLVRCSARMYLNYDKPLDDLLNGIGQQADQQKGLGFNIYNSEGSHHVHACCHPTLREGDCSLCIHDALQLVRDNCWGRVGGFISEKIPGSNYMCEVRYENYDMDSDYFSCSRY
ncbi:hypothetical protein MLD38_027230 [Melastoma candidum]|uniref:Uncharacterized protein n=1 Tax=Melastoma candidum TaxID=119954 RepID=A0ACB9P2Y7_9MYRT|nr:hypothetical protein MLD38_027230 [Melastoma candidum]